MSEEAGPQNALDIFQREWSSSLPPEAGNLHAGQAQLFEDPRIDWAREEMGGFAGLKVLELGPLEGGHSYMLEKSGAMSVLAIEANTRAFLKCLVVKEILGLERCHFLLGDFVEYLKRHNDRFDVCLASGVLYHMRNPVELIYLISRVSDRIILWTHYYDADLIESSADASQYFSDSKMSEYEGFRHRLHRHSYMDALEREDFCGGTAPYSFWMSREDILSCLRHFGFSNLKIGFEDPQHPHGPAFCVMAERA